MNQLIDEAIAELKEWETHRKLAFQNWDALTEDVHDVIRAVTKRGLDLNQSMATFFQQKLDADREYARRLRQQAPVPEEGNESLGVLEFLYETQRRTAKHMEKWCLQLEKDLEVVTGENGLVMQFKQTSENKLSGLTALRTAAREYHKSVCDDWLAHQLRHATNQNSGPDHVPKDLFETERHFRQQATLCQNAQVAATEASEEALQEIRKLELWRHEMLTKLATSFGQKLHKCWTEMQTITNEGIMWLSQHNYKNSVPESKPCQNEEKPTSTRTKEIDDLFLANEGVKSKMQQLKELADYERLPPDSRFERFSGKLLRPPRGINPLGQWKEVLVVVTVDGLMHGVPPDPSNREMIFSINCNDASIRTQKTTNFEIEESEGQSWGFFSKKNKVTLRAKSKEERDQWMRVLQHFQTNPVDFEQLRRDHNRTPSGSPRNWGSAGTVPPPPPPPPPPRQRNESSVPKTSVATLSPTASSNQVDGVSVDALSEQHATRESEATKTNTSTIMDTSVAKEDLPSPTDVISEKNEAQSQKTVRHSDSVFE